MKHRVPHTDTVEREGARSAAQRVQSGGEAAADQLHQSPRQLKQEQRVKAAFGDAVQRVGDDEELLQSKRDRTQLQAMRLEQAGLLQKESSWSFAKSPSATPIQLSRARDRERLAAARANRTRFLAVLLVMATNIVNGNYAFEDVDDLLEGNDRELLRQNVQEKRAAALARQAQQQEFRAQQRSEKQRQKRSNRPQSRGRK